MKSYKSHIRNRRFVLRDLKSRQNDFKAALRAKPALSACAFFVAIVVAPTAQAELRYTPVLPQFGGSNGQALSILQYEASLKAAAIATAKAEQAAFERALAASAAAAAAAEAIANGEVPASTTPTATDRLIAALSSAIQVRLANSYADQIFDSFDTSGPQTIVLDGTEIIYARTDGVLTITIVDDANVETRFEVYVGGQP